MKLHEGFDDYSSGAVHFHAEVLKQRTVEEGGQIKDIEFPSAVLEVRDEHLGVATGVLGQLWK
jgi:hypothetical protein